jgi:hypothetical protein
MLRAAKAATGDRDAVPDERPAPTAGVLARHALDSL